MTTETFYRYEDVKYAPPLDEYDMPIGKGRLEVVLREYQVLHRTPCGVRLETDRFVNTTKVKQFAHATKAAALTSFMARKKSEARIYLARLERAEFALEIARAIARGDEGGLVSGGVDL